MSDSRVSSAPTVSQSPLSSIDQSGADLSRSGIYMIYLVPTMQAYVGAAVNVDKRWKRHKRELRQGSHPNNRLQRAWDTHGEDNFQWSVLEYVERARLLEREQHHLDLLDISRSLNLIPVATGPLAPEVAAKLAARNRGKHLSDETRAKMREASRNRSPEALARVIEAARTPEARAKLAEAARNRSPETRAKMSEAHRGKFPSQETRARMGEAQRGRVHTPETKAKITGRPKKRKLPARNQGDLPGF